MSRVCWNSTKAYPRGLPESTSFTSRICSRHPGAAAGQHAAGSGGGAGRHTEQQPARNPQTAHTGSRRGRAAGSRGRGGSRRGVIGGAASEQRGHGGGRAHLGPAAQAGEPGRSGHAKRPERTRGQAGRRRSDAKHEAPRTTYRGQPQLCTPTLATTTDSSVATLTCRL
jgi:hypothetical protein